MSGINAGCCFVLLVKSSNLSLYSPQTGVPGGVGTGFGYAGLGGAGGAAGGAGGPFVPAGGQYSAAAKAAKYGTNNEHIWKF